MSYEKLTIDNVFLVRWVNPELADGKGLLADVQRAFEVARRKLVYIAVAPENSPPPPDELRRSMAEGMQSILKWCDTVHLVFEGKGFDLSLKRIALASILLVSGMRGKVFVHPSVEQIGTHLDMRDKFALTRALRHADQVGFLKKTSPITP